MKPTKVVVVVEDGIVQWITSDEPLDVAILDIDTESPDDDELTEIQFEDGPDFVYAAVSEIRDGLSEAESTNPEFVKQVFLDIKKETESDIQYLGMYH